MSETDVKPEWWCELHDETLAQASFTEWKTLRGIDPWHSGAVKDLTEIGYLESKPYVIKKVTATMNNVGQLYRRVK